MRTLVNNSDGRIAYIGSSSKHIPNTTEIDTNINLIPSDYHRKKKPYLWSFVGTTWVVDQDTWDAISAGQTQNADDLQTQKDFLVTATALIDDPDTNWQDPQGDLVEDLYKTLQAMLRKV